MVYKRRRPIGGKIQVKYLNTLLDESYKEKKNTNPNIDDRYILDPELSQIKQKYMLIEIQMILLLLLEAQAILKML
jgi:hypothetical protein